MAFFEWYRFGKTITAFMYVKGHWLLGDATKRLKRNLAANLLFTCCSLKTAFVCTVYKKYPVELSHFLLY